MADTPISKLAAAGALEGDEPIIVSQRSTSIMISAATISALASDQSFNDSGSGFIAAGFAVGDYVNVSGFTGNTANNIFSAEITALTAGKMTIGGSDGAVIVDDAAGETVVISKWVSRRVGVNEVGGGLQLIASTTISSPVANVDFTNLAGYTEFLITVRNITCNVNDVPSLRVSTNNGASFYNTVGDYVSVTVTGVETAGSHFGNATNSLATTARSGFFQVLNNGPAGSKVSKTSSQQEPFRFFVASADEINALRIYTNSGNNFTGGTIRVWGR